MKTSLPLVVRLSNHERHAGASSFESLRTSGASSFHLWVY
jgi:hypothetical protein